MQATTPSPWPNDEEMKPLEQSVEEKEEKRKS